MVVGATRSRCSSVMKKSTLAIVLAGLSISLSAEAADKVSFGKQIYPIIREKCLSCHAAPYEDERGRTKKPKAGIRYDTPEWIAKGYLNDDDEQVPSVVPGKPEKSPLYTTTILPEDHDDIMPPKGDPLTKAEQNLLKQWILEGADYGGFKAPAYVNPKAKK